MHAMILCAGLGTRLRPLTDERPKPLIPLSGRPLAAHAIDVLADVGVRHLVANAHHLAAQIEPGLRPWAEARGCDLTVSVEPEILGTGGGIRRALPHLGGGDFVVFNGDVFARPDLARALSHHRATNALLTMVLRDDPDATKLGAIEVTDDGRVVRMLGEGPPPAVPTRRCVFTGIYVVSSRVADDLPAEGCVVRHTLRRLLARGETVSGVVDDGAWFDLGTPERYASVQFAQVRAQHGGAYVSPTARVSPTVRLGGDVYVGDGAVVTGAGALSETIVWDGATVDVPCHRAIVGRTTRAEIRGALDTL